MSSLGKDLVLFALSLTRFFLHVSAQRGGHVKSQGKDSGLQDRKRDCLTADITLSLIYRIILDKSNLRR